MTAHVVGASRLKRQLERSAEGAGCAIDWLTERTSPFNAASFVGGKHAFVILLTTPGGIDDRHWLEQLDEYAVDVPGFVLAQLEVGLVEAKGEQWVAEIEALTVKEA